MILKWREYVPDASLECYEQFGCLLDEAGLGELDAKDTFTRICQRYCGYAKLIYLKRPEYFESMWSMQGVANQFAGIGVKWFIPIMSKRLSKENKDLLNEDVAKELIRWATTRYNFWIGEQL